MFACHDAPHRDVIPRVVRGLHGLPGGSTYPHVQLHLRADRHGGRLPAQPHGRRHLVRRHRQLPGVRGDVRHSPQGRSDSAVEGTPPLAQGQDARRLPPRDWPHRDDVSAAVYRVARHLVVRSLLDDLLHRRYSTSPVQLRHTDSHPAVPGDQREYPGGSDEADFRTPVDRGSRSVQNEREPR